MKNISTNIRKSILHIANLSGSPHIGSALSCTDISTTLDARVLLNKYWR